MGIEWRWIASNFYVLNDEFIATTYDSRTMTDNYILELYNSQFSIAEIRDRKK